MRKKIYSIILLGLFGVLGTTLVLGFTGIPPQYRSLLAGLGLLALLGIATIQISSWYRRHSRIKAITQQAQKIAKEDFVDQGLASHPPGEQYLELQQIIDNLETKLKMLNAERDQLNAVLQGMREGLLVTDPKGKIILANPSFYEVFNLETRCEGKTVLESLLNKEIHESLEESLKKQIPIEREISFRLQETEKNIMVHFSPLTSGSKNSGAILVFFDVSQIRKLERARRDFVANVSHELKTPLTSIRGFAETLADGAITDKKIANRFLEKIETNAAQLQNLIEDLLHLSEIESGRAPFQPKNVVVEKIVEDTQKFFQESLEKKKIRMNIEIPAGLSITSEPAAFKQILFNLIENAIKYNKEGGSITLSAVANGKLVRFSLSDTGIGIPKKDLPHVFERFYRVDKARSRDMGGTGLGLAIVKHLVHTQGGEVQVQSEEGMGTQLTFSMPQG